MFSLAFAKQHYVFMVTDVFKAYFNKFTSSLKCSGGCKVKFVAWLAEKRLVQTHIGRFCRGVLNRPWRFQDPSGRNTRAFLPIYFIFGKKVVFNIAVLLGSKYASSRVCSKGYVSHHAPRVHSWGFCTRERIILLREISANTAYPPSIFPPKRISFREAHSNFTK